MKIEKISQQSARCLAIHAQMLAGTAALSKDKEGAAHVIEHLGYVQIDTIHVIQRAHHHTLWSRRHNYQPALLHALQADDRRIFEYWGHAMSYLPMRDYRFYLPTMHSFNDPYSKWEKRRLEKYGHLMQPVLEQITAQGAMATKDFTTHEQRKGGTWWDWRPVKVALELLFWQGRLMVSERRKFQKVYDLTERILPPDVDTTLPSDEQVGAFLVRRALTALGIAHEKEISDYIHVARRKKLVKQALCQLLESAEIVQVEVENTKAGSYYALAEMLDRFSDTSATSAEVHILSPFDNFCIQRERLQELFGFSYALECYLKAGDRQFGYFALPVLWQDRLVARMDAKADRKSKILLVHKLGFEDGLILNEGFFTAFNQKLMDFARFNDCQSVQIADVQPAKYKKRLKPDKITPK